VFFHALEKWELSCVPFSLSNSKTKNWNKYRVSKINAN
jgi:hypothetical protein